jgi:hypothetical protein
VKRFRLIVLPALALVCAGCATAISPATCSSTAVAAAHAPANFGTVTAKVFRGADLTTCAQFAFLESQGVRHILQLNASKQQAAAGVHAEGRFEVMPVAFSAFTVGRPGSCMSVRAALSYLEDPKNWPIYVHCSAGRDRTGYLVGMFEREALHKPIDSVVEELGEFGHKGLWSLLFGQIDRELARAAPACRATEPNTARP